MKRIFKWRKKWERKKYYYNIELRFEGEYISNKKWNEKFFNIINNELEMEMEK